jgi:hypothetical protein
MGLNGLSKLTNRIVAVNANLIVAFIYSSGLDLITFLNIMGAKQNYPA